MRRGHSNQTSKFGYEGLVEPLGILVRKMDFAVLGIPRRWTRLSSTQSIHLALFICIYGMERIKAVSYFFKYSHLQAVMQHDVQVVRAGVSRFLDEFNVTCARYATSALVR